MELDDKECGLLRFLTACGTGYRMLMVELESLLRSIYVKFKFQMFQ